MQKFKIVVATILVITIVSCSSDKIENSDFNVTPVEIKIASYNIRYPEKADVETGNSWDIRKEPVAELIKKHDFDIFGVQEPYMNQIDDLETLLPEYNYVIAPYATQSYLAIFYKPALFKLFDDNIDMFWLSETSDEPSIGWDADDIRIVHWAKFMHRETNAEFYFFNTHFYWRNKTARKNSGPLAARKINDIAGDSPVIFVGDLNSEPNSSQVQRLKVDLNDAFDIAQSKNSDQNNTNLGGGNFSGEPKNRIDYIFVSKDIIVKDFTTHLDTYLGHNDEQRFPSDHLPISSTIYLK